MKNLYSLLFAVFIAAAIFLPKIQAQTAVVPSGSGTQADPYLIANFNNLYWLSVTDTVWGSARGGANYKYFKQTADIDASSSYNLNSGGGISPIGINSTHPFNCTYDGNGHTISNLRVYKYAALAGLFGEVLGTIENLGIKNADVIETVGNVGVLAGQLDGGGLITGCYTTGRIVGSGSMDDVGGLVGSNSGTLQNSYSTVSISTSSAPSVGGLAGTSSNTISNCYSTGNITVNNTSITYAGGLTGSSTGSILNSYSTGNVSVSGSASHVGGGLIGLNQSAVDNCFSSGWVSSSGAAGGLIGDSASGESVSNSYWDTNTSGQSSSAGGTGETNTNMLTQSTFSSWDFGSTWAMTQGTNYSYPYLQNAAPLPAEVTTFSAAPITDKSGQASLAAVVLKWQTATEVNNYGFEVERQVGSGQLAVGNSHSSIVNSQWKDLGFVKGAGTSNSPKEYSFVDNDPSGGSSFEYRLKQVDIDGNVKYSNVVAVKLTASQYKLSQNYPNPFNPSTTIDYELPKQSRVVIKLYDILGQEVATLVDKEQQSGKYSVQLNANHYGLASGMYIYRLQVGKYNSVKKLILLK